MVTQSSKPRQDRVIPLAGGADSAGEWIYVSTAEARAVGSASPLSLAHARHRVLRDTVPHGIPWHAVRDTVPGAIPCRAGYLARVEVDDVGRVRIADVEAVDQRLAVAERSDMI